MATEHDIDPSEIDELDEISGDEQLCLVWCDTHKTYEWHWPDTAEIGIKRRKPHPLSTIRSNSNA